jgi:hypothetical protein
MKKSKLKDILLFQILIPVVFSIPFVIILYLMSLIIMSPVYQVWHDVLGFNWTPGGRRVDIRRFLEFWHWGIGVHILNVLLFSIVSLKFKLKLHYHILSAIVFPNLYFIAFFPDMLRRPSIGAGMGDPFAGAAYPLSWALLFAMIMFICFTISTVLLDKHAKLKELKKILLSFGLSLIAGGVLSRVVWGIHFQIFHG